MPAVAAGKREGGEEARHAVIGDGEILPAGFLTERAGEPALSDAAGAGDQEIVALTDPVAAGELEEQRAIETTDGAVVDVIDAGGMAQPGGAGAGLEALLPAQRHFLFDDEREPFGMAEAGGLWVGGEILEALGHAVEAEVTQVIEGRMGEHAGCLLQWK